MRKVMGHVGEEGALCANPRGGIDRLIHVEMCGMTSVTQRVEHQNIETVELGPRPAGDLVAVGQISEGADAVTQDGQGPVAERHRDNCATLERKRSGDRKQLELWEPTTLWGRRVKDVGEHPSHICQRSGIAVTWNRRALSEVVNPYVVEPQHMVGVTVGEKNEIDPVESVS